MKHRSPTRVLVLSLLTLSLYDLYWFAATSRELARVTSKKLWSANWNILFAATRLFALLALVWAMHVLVFSNSIAAPSVECQQQQRYNITISATQYPLSDSCRQAIANYVDHQNRQADAWKLLAVAFVIGIGVNILLFQNWLIPYVKAAQIATNNRFNATNSVFLLLWRESYGVAALQQAYNDPASVPDFAGKNYLEALPKFQERKPHPVIKTFLSTVAIALGIFVVLGVVLIIVLTHS